MKNRSKIQNVSLIISFLILISIFSIGLAIPVEAAPAENDARMMNIQDSPYKSYLPMIQKPYPIYISPGSYPVKKCVETSVYSPSTGDYIGELTECVPSVEVRLNGTMQLFLPGHWISLRACLPLKSIVTKIIPTCILRITLAIITIISKWVETQHMIYISEMPCL